VHDFVVCSEADAMAAVRFENAGLAFVYTVELAAILMSAPRGRNPAV
jgi:hypothetical protein